MGFVGVVCEYIKDFLLETNYSLTLLDRFLLTVLKNTLKIRGAFWPLRPQGVRIPWFSSVSLFIHFFKLIILTDLHSSVFLKHSLHVVKE